MKRWMNCSLRARWLGAVRLATSLAILSNAGCGGTRLQGDHWDAHVDVTPPHKDGGAADALTCPSGKPLPQQPCFTCAPLASGADGGCGGPLPGLWGWDGGATPDGGRYPVGCNVALPVENPFYPGGPQYCSCDNFGPTGPSWLCPL